MKCAVLLATLLGWAVVSQSSAESVTATNNFSQETTATATFESVDLSGCIRTSVSIAPANEFQHKTGGPTVTNDQTSLEIAIINVCDAEPPSLLTRGASASQQFVVSPDLKSATLTAQFVGLVDQNDLAFDSTVNITFTAIDAVRTRTSHSTHRSTTGAIVLSDFITTGCSAVATGSVSIENHPLYPNNPNIVPLPSVTTDDQTTIARVIETSVTVTIK
jgi:hypothetical protein